jgi:hypothetical protein
MICQQIVWVTVAPVAVAPSPKNQLRVGAVVAAWNVTVRARLPTSAAAAAVALTVIAELVDARDLEREASTAVQASIPGYSRRAQSGSMASAMLTESARSSGGTLD